MTNQEFSNEFDILYNNVASNQAPGLDEYEKSVFLTNAQDAIILELFSGKNVLGDSFEKTEEVRQYLSDIIKDANLSESISEVPSKISSKSTLYETPEDLWFIVYEQIKFDSNSINCRHSGITEIVPVTHDEYSRIMKNPFRRATANRVLRLNIQGKIELVSPYTIENYSIRYISKLSPIILGDLPAGLTIKGESKETNCKLNSVLHRTILERAVQAAKVSMGLVGTEVQN